MAACGGTASSPTLGSSAAPVAELALAQNADSPVGLALHLSNGTSGPPAFDHAQLAPAKKLAEADAQAILARAPLLPVAPDDMKAFALRPGSQPAPRTSQTVAQSFPPSASSLVPPPNASDAHAPLKVLRYMPEGAVPLAPQLSVTFSQPMIAVTSQTDAAANVPVTLTPTPKGKWRWIGTRTIVFDPDDRFPQATTYHVSIAAGTKSAQNTALAAATAFSFETPPPTLVTSWPSSDQPQRTDVPMFALFDQKIDPAAMLASIHVTVAGKSQAIRQLTAAELAKDKTLHAMADQAKSDSQDARWIAFRTDAPLPTDATVTVTVAAGAPSAEGSNKTKADQSFTFRTYPPLKLVQVQCAWGSTCPPGVPLTWQFNNPIDEDKTREELFTTTPAIDDAKLVIRGDYVTIQGATTPRTKYTLKVAAGVVDEFGQALAKPDSGEIAVGDAQPTFFGPSGLTVLDPAASKKTIDVFSTNYPQLKVKVFKVAPSDYAQFQVFTRDQYNHDHPPTPPGTKVFDGTVPTAAGDNKLVETHVDIAAALDRNGFGHALAVIEPSPWTETYPPPRLLVWAQSTQLAIDAHVDGDNVIAMATELATGKPASGVELSVTPAGLAGKTDAQGMATLPLTGAPGAMLLARRGADVAFVTADGGNYYGYGAQWSRREPQHHNAWYIVDDRNLYKPGETVSIKGWLRSIDYGKNGDVDAFVGGQTIDYKVYDSRNNQIGSGSAAIDPVGGWATSFALPGTPNLGYARVDFELAGEHHGFGFQIEEFRRPEFEVRADASQGPFLVGSGGDVTVKASYFAGGPLAGAPVTWSVSASPASFSPPNHDDYTFGAWVPWWGGRVYNGDVDDEEMPSGPHGPRSPNYWNLTSTSDATGSHTLHMDFLSLRPARPMAVVANAQVADVNRQAQNASASLIVHPASVYAGVKLKRSFVEKGTPFDLDVIAVDLDGKPAVGTKVEVTAVRLDWQYKKGTYRQQEVERQTCAVVAAAAASACEFATPKGGEYKIVATLLDPQGRANQTEANFWVSGGDSPPAREVTREQVQLIPSQKEFAPGDRADLLVQAPFPDGEALVTWRRSGVVHSERFTMTGSSATIHVPITYAMTPGLQVQVDVVGAAARAGDDGKPDPSLPKRPAYAVGAISLSVPPRQRTLAVAVEPSAKKLAPGDNASVSLVVRDAAGQPVANAQAAVIVVDEAILALTSYDIGSPIDTFYPGRSADVQDFYERQFVKLARPDATRGRPATKSPVLRAAGGRGGGGGMVGGATDADGAMMALDDAPGAPPPPAPMAQAAAAKPQSPVLGAEIAGIPVTTMATPPAGQQPAPIAVRTNFNPLAAFAPAVTTDAQGHATVSLKLPDNLTRYRIIAVVAAGTKQFGKGESSLTARLPLMVRPSPPRFLNFGDTFKLPVVVQNQTDAPMTVRLAVRATNAAITDGAGREVTVPPNDRVEVQFPAAAELAGTARIQVLGVSGTANDAADISLPVWTPATTEAFATYGVVDNGATKQPIALPGKVITDYGALEVSTSSTQLGALTDAFLYLVHYPFECAEQRSSRIVAIAALRDVLTAFHAKEMPSQAALETSVAADVLHLTQMQNTDGGFAFWDRGYPSEPYLSVFVTDALTRAKAKGFAIPETMLTRARGYLTAIDSHIPSYYSDDERHAIVAYALVTRKRMGDVDIAGGQALLRTAGGATKLPMEADGWLLSLFAGVPAAAGERADIERYAHNHVAETAGAANFTTGYGDGAYLLLASDRRVDGVMLDALIDADPQSDLIPKIVTGLLAHRTAGRWDNTQENAFVLVALDHYFQVYEKTTPSFVARVWLGNDYAGDHAFKGHTTEISEIDVPMKAVAAHDHQDLTISKDGAGRMYYRVGMTYAPASLKVDPADYGFVVERKYEGADNAADVTRAADGTWHVKAGARVRVKVTMVNQARRYQVALVDPMPAGFEALNPALATTGPIPTDPKQQAQKGAYWWWYGPWYEHQNMRDERVEAFASLLWEGVHEYTYVARATTPGEFVVPPPKAEEMYMPETFGRGGTDRVIVE